MNKQYKGINIYSGICSIIISLYSTTIFAVAYNYPSTASAPLVLSSGDTLSVDSGTMQNLNDPAAFTVSMDQATTVTIQPGAAVSYNSPGVGTAALLGIPSVAGASTRTILNNGNLSNGNALYAIFIDNTTPTNDYIIQNTGNISGNIALSSIRNATISFNGTPTMQGNIALAVTGTATVNIGDLSATTYTSQGIMSGIDLIEVFGGSYFAINNEFTTIRAIQIDANGKLNLYSRINGAFLGDGAITNAGTFNIAADVNKTNTFTTTATGNTAFIEFSNVYTTTYDASAGTHTAQMFDIYNIGEANFVTASPQFGKFVVKYTGGYLPQNTFTLVIAPTITTAPTSYSLPNSTLFLTFATPTVDANTIKIFISRIGFQNYAQEGITQQIGSILEAIGPNSPSQALVNLLNAIEASSQPLQVQNSLRQLEPLMSAPLYTFMLQDQALEQVHLRIQSYHRERLYSSGDGHSGYNTWFRAFGDRANQNPTGNTQGYYANTTGGVLGLDKILSPILLFGGALSVAHSTVTDKINVSSETAVKSYQLMMYAGYDCVPYYVNWTLALANNIYDANRNVFILGYDQNATGSYVNQQYGGKIVLGRNFRPQPYLQFSPECSTLFSLASPYRYQESGGNATNLYVIADSANMVQLAAGFKLEFPCMIRKMLVLPELHFKALYNIVRGTQNMFCNFLEGGTQFNARAGLPTVGMRYGASILVAQFHRLELKLNWDRTAMQGYTDNMLYFNIRYAL